MGTSLPPSLTGPQIGELITRYVREMARYEKAATLVGERLRRELREAGLKHMVSHRPKHPGDLAEKLRRKSKEKPEAYTWDKLHLNLGDVVTDLAGCRVVVYSPEDEGAVAHMVSRVFAQPARHDAAVIHRVGVDRPYWATHALVHPYGPTDVPEASVEGAVCELQIVTVAAHLFNEVEHDITYKQNFDGLPADADELQLLDELRGVVRVADRLVTSLARHRQQRREDASHVIADPEELNDAFRRLTGRRMGGGDLGSLLSVLGVLLDAVTVENLAEIGEVGTVVAAGREILGEDASSFRDTALYAVGLRKRFGEHIDGAARELRGPRTAIRRALDLARDRVSRQTQEEP
jgi:ppGpp synthetase/RelA/SpoT-type nucleotidyltranferase